ncbi:hypothetical protein [Paenibacillus graminis]|uniref:hypothetical protein n=1 Tax=Paenibacillus graminis TaxID=189425 RepID=UPI0004B38422|nr:hypothetical protein [Paenibacillus graminis]
MQPFFGGTPATPGGAPTTVVLPLFSCLPPGGAPTTALKEFHNFLNHKKGVPEASKLAAQTPFFRLPAFLRP